MGSCVSAERSNGIAEKMKLLQKEIKEMMEERERESGEYEEDVMVFAFKEAEWRQERKRLREEVRRLREDNNGGVVKDQMEEERAWRDEAVLKWKKLYLAIKKELDDLIHRTHQGGLIYWGAEEEELKRELQQKEETIKALKMQLASAEREGYKSKREADILRQSLRIMSNNKKLTTPKQFVNRK